MGNSQPQKPSLPPELERARIRAVADLMRSASREDRRVVDHMAFGAAYIADVVRGYERAGVAAMHLEDQVSPKRCGAMAGKALVSDDEMAARLRAALRARRSPDFLIIGRTDAMTIGGIDEAVRRLQCMEAVGVDAVMVPSLSSSWA